MTTHDPADAGNAPPGQVLAKLRRIYGHGALQRDAFGRRPALASEVARQLQRRHSPANAQSPATAAVEGRKSTEPGQTR